MTQDYSAETCLIVVMEKVFQCGFGIAGTLVEVGKLLQGTRVRLYFHSQEAPAQGTPQPCLGISL